ncbi:hypothetical protein D3C76_826030 [compost metagenome]|uniref:Uncharacterized conserved protein YjiS, DUF1127 family n=1 Tax=Pseudomonas jinjuensis TaxID=198616 RepID=A0A1H0C4K1_9PSED|nr:DUF1127 domain-containing protein [Pseudomonas jinjuensis]SDN52772.1 Uncharacterized conserved protein YjiS, DUF1127 family [Pseudomonas jinjuensis]
MGRTLVSTNIASRPVSSSSHHSLVGTMRLWQRRIESRRQLARLDSRLLADAGISEAQRYAELSKPFWR